jgi:hypothetical protein
LFSTYLVTGDGTAPAVNNGIDVSGQGGLVWIKKRSAAGSHSLFDTARGANLRLISNDTAAQDSVNLSFTSTGFSNYTFDSAVTYTSWTFREQPKFFDVVTLNYTSGAAVFNHSLGSVPGFVIVKVFDGYADNWWVYHRSLGNNQYLSLNLTSQAQTSTGIFSATDTTFTVKNGIFSASTIVAYLYAHDAGGFGLTGTDNVISCGSYTTDGSGNATINLGYEPQWLMVKASSGTYGVSDWRVVDVMRGMSQTNIGVLYPNYNGPEDVAGRVLVPTATGFLDVTGFNNTTFIYIAIRRGPMKVPTVGTSVFSPIVATNSQGTENTTGFPLDMQIANIRSGYASNGVVPSRLTGVSSNTTSSGSYLRTPSTNAETTGSDITQYWGNTGFQTSSNWAGSGMVYWNFRRAPSFFDEVCYTGNGGINNVQNHSLADSIGMLIIKRRDSTGNWSVFVKESGGNYSYWNSSGTGTGQGLNGTGAATGTNYSGYNSYLTSTTFNAAQIAGSNDINANGGTYVAYLFATCAGVSKVGSYTGTGAAQTINCGFTAGSRFVMIKRTDSTGDWYVWDSARGIIPSNDPYLLINSTAAEVTGTDYVDTSTTGFDITSTAPAAINANGGTFIFLAIA